MVTQAKFEGPTSICHFCKAQNPAGSAVCRSCGMPTAETPNDDWFERTGSRSFLGLKFGAEGLAVGVLVGAIVITVPLLWAVREYKHGRLFASKQAHQVTDQDSDDGANNDSPPPSAPQNRITPTVTPGNSGQNLATLPVPPPGHPGANDLRLPRHPTPDPKPALVSKAVVKPPVPAFVPPPSILNFQADPGTIERGGSTLLRWSVSSSATVKIEPGSGTFQADAGSGQVSVSPDQTTEYTLTAEGPGGTVSSQYTVRVAAPPKPALTFEAEPASIIQGQGAKLYWGVNGAAKVSISPEIGAVSSSGSMTVRPSRTVTYTLTAEGPGGVSTRDVTVSVGSPSQSAGELVWSGVVNSVQIVTIDKDHADVGNLEGSLPGTACIVQPLDEKHVSIASSPGPRNNYERLVLRVTGKGLVRVVVKWSLQ